MEESKIFEILNKLPKEPGCYQFIGAQNKILYIGKARSLKDRVRQYFVNSSDNRFFIAKLPPLLEDIRIIITASEKEALILEAELIRRHKPPFNVDLKDDKRYLSVRLDMQAEFPRLELVRKVSQDKANYYGPYSSSGALRNTVKLIRQQFGLRTCSDRELKLRSERYQTRPRSTRPCLQYELKRCLAPCCQKCTAIEYREAAENVRDLLSGGEKALIDRLSKTMAELAGRFAYEEAAKVRDQIAAVKHSMEEQTIVLKRKTDIDIYAIAQDATGLAIALLQIRQGILRDLITHFQSDLIDDAADSLSQFIRQWYYLHEAPKIICTPMLLPWQEEIGRELSERYDRKVEITEVKRGLLAKLAKKAQSNAEQTLKSAAFNENSYEQVAAKVAAMLKLPAPPHRLECIDISQLQATNVVGVTVAFNNGEPDKKNYRRYRIKGASDDFAAVYEVVKRRVARGGKNLPDYLPDLLVIDGGRGQLSAALAALNDSNMADKVPLVAMAKARTAPSDYRENNQARQHERLFLPGRKNPIILREGSSVEKLFIQLRDATHHAAITYHRKLRAKNSRHSVLDNISGLGPSKKRLLIGKFGSVKGIAAAKEEELTALPGINEQLAETILGALKELI